METKTIKVSEETYRWLARLAGKLQQERGEIVSLNGVLTFLRERYDKKEKSL